jgi:hypothetical protein
MSYKTSNDELTTREKQILALYIQVRKRGKADLERIAGILGMKPNYLRHILDDIQFTRDLKDRKALQKWALANGYDQVKVEVQE